jgi:hypothetical protein
LGSSENNNNDADSNYFSFFFGILEKYSPWVSLFVQISTRNKSFWAPMTVVIIIIKFFFYFEEMTVHHPRQPLDIAK